MNRHPSTAWRPDLDRCRWRLTERLEDDVEAPWPELGAAALIARGTTGLRLEQWAEQVGVDMEIVEAAEAGALPLNAWPRRLRLAVRPPAQEWTSVAACALALPAQIREERQPGAEERE
jgi:hypothetical protein